jgi:hypothetical protein
MAKAETVTVICESIVWRVWDPRRLNNPMGLHSLSAALLLHTLKTNMADSNVLVIQWAGMKR